MSSGGSVCQSRHLLLRRARRDVLGTASHPSSATGQSTTVTYKYMFPTPEDVSQPTTDYDSDSDDSNRHDDESGSASSSSPFPVMAREVCVDIAVMFAKRLIYLPPPSVLQPSAPKADQDQASSSGAAVVPMLVPPNTKPDEVVLSVGDVELPPTFDMLMIANGALVQVSWRPRMAISPSLIPTVSARIPPSPPLLPAATTAALATAGGGGSGGSPRIPSGSVPLSDDRRVSNFSDLDVGGGSSSFCPVDSSGGARRPSGGGVAGSSGGAGGGNVELRLEELEGRVSQMLLFLANDEGRTAPTSARGDPESAAAPPGSPSVATMNGSVSAGSPLLNSATASARSNCNKAGTGDGESGDDATASSAAVMIVEARLRSVEKSVNACHEAVQRLTSSHPVAKLTQLITDLSTRIVGVESTVREQQQQLHKIAQDEQERLHKSAPPSAHQQQQHHHQRLHVSGGK